MPNHVKEIKKPETTTYFNLNHQVNIPKDGKVQLGKDKEAVKAYFLEHVNPNTVFFHDLKEKLDYLTTNNYIESEFLEQYDYPFIKEVFDIAYGYHFRFQSFMGAYKFYTQYALKTRDGEKYLERYEDRLSFVALYIAKGDKELARATIHALMKGTFTFATPTTLNAGKVARGEFSSCYIVNPQDNMESIAREVTNGLQLSKRAGGVGYILSNLRESGAAIKGIENASSGVVPVMKILEDSFSYANQIGARQGAGVAYLSVFHPDIYEFLSTKKENADEKIRLKTLSLGLIVPDKYYGLLKTNEPMYLFSPLDVEREYKEPFAYINVTEEYDNMVDNPNIKKYKTNARELEQEISRLQQESGYPYIVNIDTVNKENPINGKVIGSNLCVHGDTKILTKQGYLTIRDLAGSKAEVWNGEEWSEVDVVQTNSNQELLNIKTDSGYEVKTTPYHKFYIVEKTKTGKMPRKLRYKEVRAGELKTGDALIKVDLPVINGDKELEFAYDNGFYSGDGTTYANGRVRLDLYGEKKSLQDKSSSVEQWSEIKISEDETRLSGTARGLKEKFFVPTGEYSVKSKLSWLAGYLDADGTVANNNGSQSLQVASINKEFLKEVQLMLQTLGVDSKVTRNKEEGVAMLPKNDGTGECKEYKTKEIYRILINGNSLYSLTLLGLECNRLSWELKEPNRKCSRFVRITSVEEVEGLHDTFCFNEPKRHMGVFNGLLTGNCSEIFQVQTPSTFNEDGSYDEVGQDVICNLASLNIDKALASGDLENTVKTAIRGLSNVSELVNVASVPSIQNGNDKYHAVGLGAMGMHTALAKNKIHYGSKESLEFTDAFFRTVRYYALKASNEMAIEKNQSFYEFDKSEYADGSYLNRKYINVDEFEFTFPKVEAIFNNIKVPSRDDWKALSKSIQEKGLYNSYTMAVAPTGSISYISEASSSLHPIVNRVEHRYEGSVGSIYYPTPGLDNDTIDYFKSAYDTDMRKVIDLYAAAQYHFDQGMSLTLFMKSVIPEGLYEWKKGGTSNMTTRDLNRLRNYAYAKGIKSLYYVRTYTVDSDKEIGVNDCESCVV